VPRSSHRRGDLDCFSGGGVDLLGEVVHEDQGLDVAVSDAAAVGTQDAPGEGAILVVLDLPSWPFSVSTLP